jgi:DNA-binding MarR family transcriptional regulator
MPKEYRHRFVMLDLLEGWDWFESSLQKFLRAGGFTPMNKSQAMMLTHISAGVTRPTDVAKKMRLSRQAARHIYNQLIERGILTIKNDPSDGRSKILGFPKSAVTLRKNASDALTRLETHLQKRIGPQNYDRMREALDIEWGSTDELVRRAARRASARRKRKSG